MLAFGQATVPPKLVSTAMATEDGRAERLLNLPQPLRVGLGPALHSSGPRPCPRATLAHPCRVVPAWVGAGPYCPLYYPYFLNEAIED